MSSISNLASYDRVIVTDDDRASWRIGEITNIEDQYVTVGFYNPNTGDQYIDIFDTNDSCVFIDKLKQEEAE